jgi:abortive infection bacteriophage resistance protein
MTAFIKPSIPIFAQLHKWINRGLIVTDQHDAEHYLRTIGYYRLSAYTIPFQTGGTDHRFQADVTFDDIRRLYVFDRELRLLVIDAIERIEVAFRSQFNNHMALVYGAHWYLDEKYFIAKYDHKALLASIELLGRRSKEVFVKHCRTKYDDPRLPPSWMMTELLTCGQSSKVYDSLASFSDQKAIARGLNTSAELLRSWMQAISYIRNICAHHSRLWNRELGTAPMVPKKPKGNWINMPITVSDSQIDPHKRVYLLLAILEYLLQAVNPTSTWHERLQDLMKRNPQVSRANMGMPEEWDNNPFWRFN